VLVRTAIAIETPRSQSFSLRYQSLDQLTVKGFEATLHINFEVRYFGDIA
jgi:hypothetical protein